MAPRKGNLMDEMMISAVMTLQNKSLMAEMGQTVGRERKKKQAHG